MIVLIAVAVLLIALLAVLAYWRPYLSTSLSADGTPSLDLTR